MSLARAVMTVVGGLLVALGVLLQLRMCAPEMLGEPPSRSIMKLAAIVAIFVVGCSVYGSQGEQSTSNAGVPQARTLKEGIIH
jgi:hypothetical protein